MKQGREKKKSFSFFLRGVVGRRRIGVVGWVFLGGGRRRQQQKQISWFVLNGAGGDDDEEVVLVFVLILSRRDDELRNERKWGGFAL